MRTVLKRKPKSKGEISLRSDDLLDRESTPTTRSRTSRILCLRLEPRATFMNIRPGIHPTALVHGEISMVASVFDNLTIVLGGERWKMGSGSARLVGVFPFVNSTSGNRPYDQRQFLLSCGPLGVHPKRTLIQPLRPCSNCFRLERLPGGACTHWKAPPSRRTPSADIVRHFR